MFVDEKRRSPLIEYLKGKGIGARLFYPALHAEPVYGRKGSYPVSERVARQGLWLPSSAFLKDEQIDFICQEIRSFME